MTDRPRGGRRPEDFPEAVQLDRRVLRLLRSRHPGRIPLRDPSGFSRNELVGLTGADPRKIRYSLNRLKKRGLVVHVPKGNEGHGYWAVAQKKETETDGS